MTGIELIAQERKEQIEKHGWTVHNDSVLNDSGQLAFAASCLAFEYIEDWGSIREAPDGWNLAQWQRMYDKPHYERLIIAGALIAAELDRINHLTTKKEA